MNNENNFKNEYPMIALICLILFGIGFIFPITYTSLTVISYLLIISIFLSITGILVSFKMKEILGKATGLLFSIIVFMIGFAFYCFPFLFCNIF